MDAHVNVKREPGLNARTHRAAKQHAVETVHHTLDLILELRDKLLHGVSPWVPRRGFGHPTTYTLGGTPANVCVLPRDDAAQREHHPLAPLKMPRWKNLWVSSGFK